MSVFKPSHYLHPPKHRARKIKHSMTPWLFTGLIASLALPGVAVGGSRPKYTPATDPLPTPQAREVMDFYAVPAEEPTPTSTPAPTPTPAPAVVGPKPTVPVVRKVLAACALLGIVGYTAAACTPHAGINYNQWSYPATVMSISSICPAATPTTYVGHDPSAAMATDFMVPDGGTSAFGVNCGNAIKNWAQHLALIGGWHVHYVCFQQHIWNIQMANSGWRLMENRGSWTQNHMDHVHVSYW